MCFTKTKDYRRDSSFVGERSADELDEEYVLFGYIEQQVRVNLIEEKTRKIAPHKPQYSNNDDSEEAVMRSLAKGTSDRFGF